MNKYLLIISIVFFNVLLVFSQFNKVYESQRKQYDIAEGVFTNILSLDNGDALFGSVGWTIFPSQYYGYTFITKINKQGEIIWSRPVTDSIPEVSTRPQWLTKLNNNRFLLAGGIYSDSGKALNNWFGIYDENFNQISSNKYDNSDYDSDEFWHLLKHSSGDLIFCGLSAKQNNRGNGGLERAKAFILATDSLGNQKWYHEYLDTTENHHWTLFYHLTEDHLGNIYACGQNNMLSRSDWNGIVAKFAPDGKELWYKEVPSPKLVERFMYCKERKDGNILLVGSSSDPITLDSPVYVLVNIISPEGEELSYKRHSGRSTVGYWRCTETSDGNIIGAGAAQEKGYHDTDKRHGWAQKFNEDGDPIWERYYEHVQKPSELFFNVGITEDGGYYFGGYSWLPDIYESRNWLVRTDSNGCVVPGCLTAVNTEKDYHNNLFLLSPNPTQDYVNVYINDVEFFDREYDLYLYDQQARIVQHHEVQGRMTQLDLNSLTAGMYYYRIIDDRNKVMQSGKVVVNR